MTDGSRAAPDRPARRVGGRYLAAGVVGLGVLAWSAAIVLGLLRPAGDEPLAVTDVVWAVSFTGFLAVGGLIAARRPSNPIGWCMAIGAVAAGMGVAASEYAHAAHPGLPVTGWVAVGGEVIFTASLFLLTLAWLPLFPDGRPLSRRWAWLTRATIGVAVVTLLMIAIGPLELTSGGPAPANPLEVPALSGVAAALEPVVGVAFGLLMLLCLSAPVVRYRRADGAVRTQLRWLVLAVGVILGLLATWRVVAVVAPGSFVAGLLGYLTSVAGTVGLSAAVAVAVLRHRLYDIDRVVSRTVSYAVVTAILGGIYLVGVVGATRLVPSGATGFQHDLLVAGSTLAVAALFVPVRRRVQVVVDRRFNRSRYDAQRTIDAFSQRLRHEVELEPLVGRVHDVVEETMRPSTVMVWLRG